MDLRIAIDLFGKRSGRHVFQGKVGEAVRLADFVNLYDVRMLELPDGPRFHLKANEVLLASMRSGQNHLESDDSADRNLPGLVHHAHAAAAEFVKDLEAGDCRHTGHRRSHIRRREPGRQRRCIACRRVRTSTFNLWLRRRRVHLPGRRRSIRRQVGCLDRRLRFRTFGHDKPLQSRDWDEDGCLRPAQLMHGQPPFRQ